MPNRHLNLERLEAEYVTGDMSLRALARREGTVVSTLSRQGKIHGWASKRAAYRASKTQKAYDLLADKDAIQLAARQERMLSTLDEMLTVAAGQIPVWRKQVAAGKTPIPVKDVIAIMNMMRLIIGEPTERKEERSLVANLHAFNPEQLASLERIARSDQPDAGAKNGTIVGVAEIPGSD